MRVLLIDEIGISSSTMLRTCENNGFNVDAFDHLDDGKASFNVIKYGAIIIMSNRIDSLLLTHLEHWRKVGVSMPIIVISGPQEVSIRVKTLNAGADDWLLAPVESVELVARIKSIQRRGFTLLPLEIKHGEVVFNPNTRVTTYQKRIVKLTKSETIVLELLMLHHPKLLSRHYLEDHICTWRSNVCSNIVEVHICNLRHKLGREFIETVRGQGYRLQLNNRMIE